MARGSFQPEVGVVGSRWRARWPSAPTHWLLAAAMVAATMASGCARGLQTPKYHVASAEERCTSPAAQQLRKGAAGANLIIILLDSARADRFSGFGYRWQTTPNIDRLFADSTVFSEAYCTAPNTKASVASLFTAQFPDTHGALSVPWLMPPGGETLAQCLKSAGYTTAGFTANPVLAECFGFGRGFDHFSEVFRRVHLKPLDRGNVDGRLVVGEVVEWLRTHRDQRFFAYVHFLEPHFPYDAPPRFKKRMMTPARPAGEMEDSLAFDARLAYADTVVGELMKDIEALGLLDKSVVVLLADHGEAFGEHGEVKHGSTGYEEMAHVPLAFRLPPPCGAAPRRVPDIISLTDVMPTLLDLLQAPAPKTMQGRSRLALLAGERDTAPGFAVTRARGSDTTGGVEDSSQVSYAFRAPHYTLILGNHGKQVELYDRDEDAGERENLARQRREVVKSLRRQFVAWADTQRGRPVVLRGGQVYVPKTTNPELDEKTRRKLRALGYLK